MRIGELARRTGVSERSLRYYEQQGMLTADRTPGGHRDYPDGAVDRVVRIQELFAAGLCSEKIVELLPCMRDADGGPSRAATPRLVRQLTVERERINRMIRDLYRSRDVLDHVIQTASGEPGGTPEASTSETSAPESGEPAGSAAHVPAPESAPGASPGPVSGPVPASAFASASGGPPRGR